MTALIERRADPFGDAAPRTRYFESDAHYRRSAADLHALFARRSGLIFVTADPAPDGARLKARLVESASMRAGIARAEPGISFYDLMQRYANDLGLGDDGRGYWSVQERLGADARAGIASALLIEDADALDDYVFDQLDRFAKDAPQAPLPVFLLGSSRLPRRDGLGFLASSVVGRVAFTRPTSDEIPEYLRWRLSQAGLPKNALSDAALAEIAAEAGDDLAAADRLAAEALVRPRATKLPDDPTREARWASMRSAKTAPAASEVAGPETVLQLELSASISGDRFPALWEHLNTPLPLDAARGGLRPLAAACVAAVALAGIAIVLAGSQERRDAPRQAAVVVAPMPAAMVSVASRPAHPMERDEAPPPVPPASAMTPMPSDAVSGSSAPTAAPPPREGNRAAADFVHRGEALFAAADVAAARRFFAGAVHLGNRTAKRDLGKTYDPLALAEIGAKHQHGDPNQAALWYGRAAAAGDVEAAARLRFLLAADASVGVTAADVKGKLSLSVP
jgi:type II secretory pathway predicted ATPase ExeA